VSENRRELWLGDDMKGAGELRARWNMALIRDAVCGCYTHLVRDAVSKGHAATNGDVFRLLPVASACARPWDALASRVFKTLFDAPIFSVERRLKRALLSPRDVVFFCPDTTTTTTAATAAARSTAAGARAGAPPALEGGGGGGGGGGRSTDEGGHISDSVEGQDDDSTVSLPELLLRVGMPVVVAPLRVVEGFTSAGCDAVRVSPSLARSHLRGVAKGRDLGLTSSEAHTLLS
jgi:hypothetical protein